MTTITKEELVALWVLIAQTMSSFAGEPNVQETRERIEKAVTDVVTDFCRTLADEQRRQALKDTLQLQLVRGEGGGRERQ